jgi:hypothetical protein
MSKTVNTKGFVLSLLLVVAAMAASNYLIFPGSAPGFESPGFKPQVFNRTVPDDPGQYIVTSLPVFPGNVDGIILVGAGLLTCAAMCLRSGGKF